MYNKQTKHDLSRIILPRLLKVEEKCDRIISELSELKTIVRHKPHDDIDALIDSMERSANEMHRLSVIQREHLEASMSYGSSLFTLKVVKNDGFQQ